MHQLTSALGVVPPPEQIGPDGQPILPDTVAGGGLLADVRRLLLEHKDSAGESAALHESVAALVGTVQEDMVRRAAEAQAGLSTSFFDFTTIEAILIDMRPYSCRLNCRPDR